MRILTVISINDLCNLAENKILGTSEFYLNSFSDVLLQDLNKMAKQELGQNTIGIVGFARLLNKTPSLCKDFSNLQDYLAITDGLVIIEAEVPKDSLIFGDCTSVLDYSFNSENKSSQIIPSLFIHRDLQKYEDAFCFLSNLKLKQCLTMLLIDEDWNITDNLDSLPNDVLKNLEDKGVKQLKLEHINIF